MKEISKLTGREYHPFNYYGAPDAEHIIVAMGSVTETIQETIDYLVSAGEKVGLMIGTPVPAVLGKIFHEGPAENGEADRGA